MTQQPAQAGVTRERWRTVLTLLIGFLGSMVGLVLGLPAPGLIGATIGVSVCSILRFPTRMPDWLRNCGFGVIGCSLGSGVNVDSLHQLVQYPVSISILVLVMALMLFCSSRVLVHFFDHSIETALLASSPGALSYSLAIASTGVGDLRAIVVIQTLRLFGITTILPLILDLLGLSGTMGGGVAGTIPWTWTVVLFGLTLVAGFLFTKCRVPAAYLIGGVVISGLLHLSGVVEGRPQATFLFGGFVVTGSVIGARLSSIHFDDLRRLARAALVVFLLSTVLAALCAWPASRFLGIPFGQVWVAYAPGGVEAMAAMAMALGFDTTFVAVHHLVRIFLLLAGLPLLLNLTVKRSGGTSPR